MDQNGSHIVKGGFEPGVTICIPAYNEEATIEESVYDAAATLKKTGLGGEILVLDDASTDRTWEILQKVKENLPDLKLRRHPVNRGIAATFTELSLWAGRELVFLNSADRQWPMSALLDMLQLASRYDLIVGRRKSKHYTLARRVLSTGFNVAPRLLFGTNTFDAGSIKLVRREIYDLKMISSGVFVEAERIIRARRRGYRIGVIDVDHFPRKTGMATGSSSHLVVQSIADVAKCWVDIVLLRRS